MRCKIEWVENYCRRLYELGKSILVRGGLNQYLNCQMGRQGGLAAMRLRSTSPAPASLAGTGVVSPCELAIAHFSLLVTSISHVSGQSQMNVSTY
jgi:hypothetical protein